MGQPDLFSVSLNPVALYTAVRFASYWGGSLEQRGNHPPFMTLESLIREWVPSHLVLKVQTLPDLTPPRFPLPSLANDLS